MCLLLGCPAIQQDGDKVHINSALCAGDICAICEQVCARSAIDVI
jgi:indolepyruvate ferredoxin oxidoreductase alpha subunit